MWIQRDFVSSLNLLAATRPAILLTGARQTGKTSLLQQHFPQLPLVSLDLPSEAEQAEKAPKEFLQRHPPPLIVDEVQYAPALFRTLKGVIDARRSERGLYFLTGSQPLTLMKHVSESLAGRIAIATLEPLAFNEVRRAYPDLILEDFLLRGGYPELYQDMAIDAAAFYRSYIATYLERDLRSQLQVGSLRDFERFLRVCAARSAQLLNKSDLARDVGISPSTAAQWLSVLRSSNLVFFLEPYFANRSRSITKSPKLYFSDTGLLCSLLNIRSRQELLDSPLRGAIWETAVYAELRKLQENRGLQAQINFWRDRNHEIDFLLPRGGRFQVIEVKWSERPDGKDLRAFGDFERAVGTDAIVSRHMVCRVPHGYPLNETIAALPLHELSRLQA